MHGCSQSQPERGCLRRARRVGLKSTSIAGYGRSPPSARRPAASMSRRSIQSRSKPASGAARPAQAMRCSEAAPDRRSAIASSLACRKRRESTPAPHSWRSIFRDWSGDDGRIDRDPAEAALAHTLNATEGVVSRRDTAVEAGRPVVEAYARWLSGDAGADVAYTFSSRAVPRIK